MSIIASVDPGAHGAIAFMCGEHLLSVHDMPVVEVRGKTRVSAAGVADILGSRVLDHCYIEAVGAMPGQGVSSSFWFGYAAALIEGVAAGLSIPVTLIPAAKWKRAMSLTSDKEHSRARALQLWPGAADQFRRKKDECRAEAALLGRYAAGAT